MRIQIQTTPEDHRIAKLAALALGLTLLEAAIPSPIPGVKPGLANIITLVVLARFGIGAAVWVGLLRVVAGSLLLGSFLTPGFFLSLAGQVASLAVLSLTRWLPATWFGPVSQSIFAAHAHIAGQVALVYFWFIPHAGIAYLLPVFSLAALVFGIVNGLAAGYLLQRLPANPAVCVA